jgi:hypothetical protein
MSGFKLDINNLLLTLCQVNQFPGPLSGLQQLQTGEGAGCITLESL